MIQQKTEHIPTFDRAKYRAIAAQRHREESSLTYTLLHLPDADIHRQIQQIKKGLPLRRLLAVQTFLEIDEKELSAICDIQVRNVRRRKSGRLTPAESDRLYRLVRLCGAAVALFEGNSRSAIHWLKTANPAVGNLPPGYFAKSTPGEEEVFRLIGRLERGIF